MPDRAKRASGWTTVAFGDVVRQVKDRVDRERSGLDRYVAGEHMDTDDLRLRRWGEIGDGYLGPAFHMRFKPGHVLYGSRRTYLRKVAVADFEGITSNTTYVLEPKDPRVLLPELLPFIMQTEAFNQHSVRESKGSVNPYVNFSDLAWYELALPPVEEQRRTVALLLACDAASDSLSALRAASQEVYLSLLTDLFGLARVAEPPHSVATGPGGKEWKWGAIGDHFELQLGKMSSQESRDGAEHARYIKNNNVLWDAFELTNLPSMHFSVRERKQFGLRPGDLLVCEGGEIGRAAVWSSDVDEIFFQKAVHRLRPSNGSFSTRFMMHYLRACSTFGLLEKVATGSTILHLPQESLAGMRLPFPSAGRQREHLAQLDRVSGMSSAVSARLQTFNAVKRAALEEINQ